MKPAYRKYDEYQMVLKLVDYTIAMFEYGFIHYNQFHK